MKNKSLIRRPRILLFLFQVMAFSLIFLKDLSVWDKRVFYLIGSFIVFTYVSNLIISRYFNLDSYLFLISGMLVSIGLPIIFRISFSSGFKQLIWILLGYVAFFISYYGILVIKKFDKIMLPLVFVVYLFFGLTLVLGRTHNGSINWIMIGPNISIQLSEFTKLLVILILSAYYGYPGRKSTKYSILLLCLIYSYAGLLFLQRDLGSVMIFLGIYTVVLLVFEEDKRIILGNIILLIAGAVIGYFAFAHVRVRVSIWENPFKYIDNQGYQIVQSLFGLAEGGFFGRGIGLGMPQYISYVIYDFIFSAIVEEMGIFTGMGIIMLYMLFVYRGMKVALIQKFYPMKVVAVGISALFCIQCFVAISGVIKMIPLTGITLPFLSYGGSSMLSSYIALGLLSAASKYRSYQEDTDEKQG